MESKHRTEEELLARLYVEGQPDEHTERCVECHFVWHELQQRRRAILQPPAVSGDRLLRQRLEVERRLGADPGWRRWLFRPWLVPALALSAGLLAVFVPPTPAPKVPVAVVTTPRELAANDAQLFEDIYAEVNRVEPSGVTPVKALFEESQ